mmetsp:Transcript_15869/g.50575  ORF Transcript_15869/g.50575 Transcript_15869/m.50575 type:complete len:202 (+) Transcript_15869:113-718(+)
MRIYTYPYVCACQCPVVARMHGVRGQQKRGALLLVAEVARSEARGGLLHRQGLLEDARGDSFAPARVVVDKDNAAVAFGGHALAGLVEDRVVLREGGLVHLVNAHAHLNVARVGEGRAIAAGSGGENGLRTGPRHVNQVAAGLEVLEARRLEEDKVAHVVDVLHGVHVAPAHLDRHAEAVRAPFVAVQRVGPRAAGQPAPR